MSKPISTAAQTALNDKQNKINTFSSPLTYSDTSRQLSVDSYTKGEVDQKFTNLIGVGTSRTLDTLREIGNAINNDPNVYTTLNNAITNKQDKITTFTSPLNYDSVNKTSSVSCYSKTESDSKYALQSSVSNSGYISSSALTPYVPLTTSSTSDTIFKTSSNQEIRGLKDANRVNSSGYLDFIGNALFENGLSIQNALASNSVHSSLSVNDTQGINMATSLNFNVASGQKSINLNSTSGTTITGTT